MAKLSRNLICGLSLFVATLQPWSIACATPNCDLPQLNPPATLGQLDEMRHAVHLAKTPSVVPPSNPEVPDPDAAVAPPSAKASGSHQPDAVRVVAGLDRQGFKCHLPISPMNGERSFHCTGRVAGYSQPVDLYVPTSYRSQDKHSLAYHFVGWTNLAAFDPFTSQNGDYGSYFAKTKKNGILIIPRSAAKDQTYTEELGKPAQVNAFFNNVNHLLSSAGTPTDARTPLVLSGHSGAGVELGRLGKFAASGAVPQLRHLQGLALFDSAYNASDVPGIVAAVHVMRQNGHARLLAAYTSGATNAKENELIKRSLANNPKIQDELVHIAPDATHTPHMAFMKKYMESFYAESLP